MFAYSDETIRIPKQHFGPTRALRQQFAPARPQRWPYLLIAVLAIVGLATPVELQHVERSAQAHELLRLLGR
ncbi:MAG TPA: hypothetical protein VIV11_10370 [Kofleriaceae bacterium]